MLLLHPASLKGLGKLDGSLRPRVVDFMTKFADHESNGLRLKPLTHKPYWSARVGADHRAILAPAGGEAFFLLEIRPRGSAYENLDRLQVQVNKVTGELEFIDLDALPRVEVHADIAHKSDASTPGLFDGFTHDELTGLGVPPALLPSIDALIEDDDLFGFLEVAPTLTAEILLELATGKSLDEVAEKVTAPVAAADPVDPTDFPAALARPGTPVTTVDDAVRAVLDGEFTGWRVWLHPSQAALVDRVFTGPARVSGGPGTGKTVVAVHRAARLARRLPSGDDQPILLTTYNTNLAAELSGRLKKLLNPDDFQRVQVSTVDSVARGIAYATGERREFAKDRHSLLTLWNAVRRDLGESDLKAPFLHDEWAEVVCGQMITTRSAYIAARRDGRGVRVSRAQRDRIWSLAEVFESRLHDSGRWTWDQMRASAALAAERGDGPRFRHVIVDEAQDLTPAQWRMLRAVVDRGPDDLFLVGDAHQRIYGNQVSLGTLGVNIRGRSSRLTLSYRTTRQILAAAVRVLSGESFDDLDDGEEGLDSYRSILSGPAPVFRPTTDAVAELALIITELRACPSEVVVCAPSAHRVASLLAGIRAAGIDAGEITRDGPPAGTRVHVGTMHRLKGLEYPRVIVAGVGAAEFPPSAVRRLADEDPAAHRRELRRQRSLLFVATTRARDALTIVWHGERSELVL